MAVVRQRRDRRQETGALFPTLSWGVGEGARGGGRGLCVEPANRQRHVPVSGACLPASRGTEQAERAPSQTREAEREPSRHTQPAAKCCLLLLIHRQRRRRPLLEFSKVWLSLLLSKSTPCPPAKAAFASNHRQPGHSLARGLPKLDPFTPGRCRLRPSQSTLTSVKSCTGESSHDTLPPTLPPCIRTPISTSHSRFPSRPHSTSHSIACHLATSRLCATCHSTTVNLHQADLSCARIHRLAGIAIPHYEGAQEGNGE